MRSFLMRYLALGLFFFLLMAKSISGKTSSSQTTPSEPPPIGNFALPVSQQPGPFVSFGQNNIDKNQRQFFFEPDYQKAVNEHFFKTDLIFLYPLNDSLVTVLTLPVAVNYRSGSAHSSGLSDINFQAEYAFYNHSTSKYMEEATVVGGVNLPTGSYDKNPETGYGSSSYFIGATYSRTDINWYSFASPGMTWIAPKQNRHLGSRYYYQFGIGRNIKSKTKEYILFGLLEVNGEYVGKDKIAGSYDPDSGGNIIFITPSLMFSTERLMFQTGISLPLFQRLNGEQNRINSYRYP
ncbi:transporter [Legionella israelensis]|nr:transporter [Legionella israelensis]